MDMLQQCQKWHEEDKFQKIIDALEAIPAQERTPEMDSELARAYNNLAGPSEDRRAVPKGHRPAGAPRGILSGRPLLELPHGLFLFLSGPGGPRSAVL